MQYAAKGFKYRYHSSALRGGQVECGTVRHRGWLLSEFQDLVEAFRYVRWKFPRRFCAIEPDDLPQRVDHDPAIRTRNQVGLDLGTEGSIHLSIDIVGKLVQKVATG
jgi:hypothetical protein